MTDWLLVLILLSVAVVLVCFRFTGCGQPFTSGPGNGGGNGGDGPPKGPEYGDSIKAETSLVAYWRLGEEAGTGPSGTAKDEKGGHPGTYQVADLMAVAQSPETSHPPLLEAGQPGLVAAAPSQTSVRVNGGYISVPYSADLNPDAAKQFSVEAWVHPEWAGGELDLFRCVVASREDTGAGVYGYILYAGPVLDPATYAVTDSTQHWQVWVGDGTINPLMLVGPAVEVGETTYLLFTYDGQTQTLTLDVNTATNAPGRVSRPSTTYSPNPVADAKPLYIAMGAPDVATPLYPFFGSLQEIAFYNTALTTSQVAKHLAAAGNF